MLTSDRSVPMKELFKQFSSYHKNFSTVTQIETITELLNPAPWTEIHSRQVKDVPKKSSTKINQWTLIDSDWLWLTLIDSDWLWVTLSDSVDSDWLYWLQVTLSWLCGIRVSCFPLGIKCVPFVLAFTSLNLDTSSSDDWQFIVRLCSLCRNIQVDSTGKIVNSFAYVKFDVIRESPIKSYHWTSRVYRHPGQRILL